MVQTLSWQWKSCLMCSNSVGRGEDKWTRYNSDDGSWRTHCIPWRSSWLHRTELHGTSVYAVLCSNISSRHRSHCDIIIFLDEITCVIVLILIDHSLILGYQLLACENCKISPSRFLAKCHNKQLNQDSFVLLSFVLFVFLSCISLCIFLDCFVCQYQSSDWLWRTAPKWPRLCRVGHKLQLQLGYQFHLYGHVSTYICIISYVLHVTIDSFVVWHYAAVTEHITNHSYLSYISLLVYSSLCLKLLALTLTYLTQYDQTGTHKLPSLPHELWTMLYYWSADVFNSAALPVCAQGNRNNHL